MNVNFANPTASAAVQGPQDVPRAGEVADDDFGAGGTQGLGPFVFAADQRPDRQVAPSQFLDDGAAYAADAARSARDKNRMDSSHGNTSPVEERLTPARSRRCEA